MPLHRPRPARSPDWPWCALVAYGRQEEAGRQQDCRRGNSAPGDPACDARQVGSIRQDDRDEAEGGEYAGVPMTRSRESELEIGCGFTTPDDLHDEEAAEFDADGGEQENG